MILQQVRKFKIKANPLQLKWGFFYAVTSIDYIIFVIKSFFYVAEPAMFNACTSFSAVNLKTSISSEYKTPAVAFTV